MLFPKVINHVKTKLHQRCFHKSVPVFNYNVLQHLENRGIVKVNGDEVVPFLQGLMTNDMNHLEEGKGAMYSLFLNLKGRVMYDSIVYSTRDPKSFLIECDTNVISIFQKHLKMFKVKKRIDIELASNMVWVLLDSKHLNYNKDTRENFAVASDKEKGALKFHSVDDLNIYKDPRLDKLGARLLAPSTTSAEEIIQKLKYPDLKESKDSYRSFRYRLGIGEGVHDLPPGNCFPLEVNCDYLHGISFHKGCYIGQELTARTHHTGVVRKRLMPLTFDEKIDGEIENETTVHSQDDLKTSLGKVRGVCNNVGLGLLRVAQVLEVASLIISGNKAKTYRPSWWPAEAPKELAPGKNE